jgi:hypothetical protein
MINKNEMMTKKKKTIRGILLLCLLSSLTNVANSAVASDTVITEWRQTQQLINLSGEVITDVNGESLTGINVTVQGSFVGMATDGEKV